MLLRYTNLSALVIDAPARKLTGALFSQSAPYHPPNADAEAVATHREKILRFPSWLAGAPKAEVKADVLSRF